MFGLKGFIFATCHRSGVHGGWHIHSTTRLGAGTLRLPEFGSRPAVTACRHGVTRDRSACDGNQREGQRSQESGQQKGDVCRRE
ncbi:MAG: hypothetical protein ABI781_17380 [Burkholderiales bacterium]